MPTELIWTLTVMGDHPVIKPNPKSKGLFLLIAFMISLPSYGQYVSAIISDADGYTNVRKDSSTKSEIVEKILDGEVFEYNGDDWHEQKP